MISASKYYVKIEQAEKKMLICLIWTMKKTYLVLSLILLLGGCGVFQPKVSPYPDGILFPLEKAGEFLYDGEMIDRILKKENRLYFATRKGFIYCIDALDYKFLWRLRMQEVLKSPVFMGKSHFFIFDVKNNVYCFDLDGNTLWIISLKEEITSPLAEIGNSVFLGTSQGSFIAIDVLSGNKVWHVIAQGAIHSNPVAFEGHIIFGCDDHFLYFIDQNGNLIDKYLAKDKIFNTLLVDGKFLYFGTENHFLVCLDLKNKIKKWEVKTGGRVLPVPASDKKRVFFLAWNNVLYCLHKRNGTILWWRPIPSRSLFPLEVYKDKIVVSSMSSLLVCFDVETGARVGDFDVGSKIEMKSNPMWNSPFLLVNVYDRKTEKGKILQMKKVVQMTLSASVSSPQFVNQEISLSATTVGLHLPQYEFYIKNGEEKNVTQAASEKSTWSWFPAQPGSYTVGVSVSDEKVNKESEIPFVIEKVKPEVTLTPSKPSPQGESEEIVFTAGSIGFTDPIYELQISRVNLVLSDRGSVLSIKGKILDENVLEESESGKWIWNSTSRGLFMINLIVSDDSERVIVSRYFLILNKDELKEISKIKKAELYPSKPSPQGESEEIVFTAGSTEFIDPIYELRISRVNLVLIGRRSVLSISVKDLENIVLEKSESGNWTWNPTSRGLYLISWIALDESENVSFSRYFLILNKDELKEMSKIKKTTLYSSKPSPQGDDGRIVFNADSTGFTDPFFEFRISRVNLVLIGRRSVLSIVEKNMENIVLEKSGSENWTWTPTSRGLYLISLMASDESESVNFSRYYLILNKDELKEISKIKKERAP